MHELSRKWWVLVIRGVCGIVFGLGAYMLMFSRRRGGGPEEITPYSYGGSPLPPPSGESELSSSEGLASSDAAALPPPGSQDSMGDLGGDVAGENVEDAAPTTAPEGEEVPSAPSRARPMRRRAASPDSGGEGTSLQGMGAEEEATPGESHQEKETEG